MAKYIVQHRRGTATQWADKNTIIPREGEIVIEIDEESALHKLKIGDGKHTYAELAYLQAGDEVVTQVLAEAKPRVVTVTLSDTWTQDPDVEGKYSQVIALDDITAYSRLDLQPDANMLAEFKQLGLVFVTENKDKTVTVYSVGNAPLKSYTMQATIVETKCDGQDAVLGIPVGAPSTDFEIPVHGSNIDDKVTLNKGDTLEFHNSVGTLVEVEKTGDKVSITYDTDTSSVVEKGRPTPVSSHAVYEAIEEAKEELRGEVDQSYSAESTNAQSGVAVAEALAGLLGSAPENLDTLEELAKALNEDENFSATVLDEIAKKASKEDLQEKMGSINIMGTVESQNATLDPGDTLQFEHGFNTLVDINKYDGVAQVKITVDTTDYIQEGHPMPATSGAVYEAIQGTYTGIEDAKRQLQEELDTKISNEDLSLGENTSSISDFSVAFGVNTISGCKAFYIKSIDTTNKKIYLTNEKLIKPEMSDTDYTDADFETPAYSTGQLFSMILKPVSNSRMHLHYIAKIESVQNNVITYSGDLGFTETFDDTSEVTPTFFVTSQPDIGYIDISESSFAEGDGSIAAGEASHAEGRDTVAGGNYGHAEGRQTKAGYAAHAEGINSIASAQYSHAEGQGTLASNSASHAEGSSTKAIGMSSHAEGNGTTSKGYYTHAEGMEATADGDASHAEGRKTQALANYSHAEGFQSKAEGEASHAEGKATAVGETSHAEGIARAAGNVSHAEGSSVAHAYAAHSEGDGTEALGLASHAEGISTDAVSEAAHAEGKETTASGKYSHAEGFKSTATGEASHAEGSSSASSYTAHAEGDSTTAKGWATHSEGYGTIASGKCQHVQGRFNKEDSSDSYAHIVGGGSDGNNRKNIHTLDWHGNAEYAGKIKATEFVDKSGNSIGNIPIVYTYGPNTPESMTLMHGMPLCINFDYNMLGGAHAGKYNDEDAIILDVGVDLRNEVIENGQNAVSSGAVYNAIEAAKEEVSLSIEDIKGELRGEAGVDGITPHIGDNGNWWIGDTDTGKIAVALTDGATVAQTTGNSETSVMSQKAATDTFYGTHVYRPLLEKITAHKLPNTVIHEKTRLQIASADNTVTLSAHNAFKVLQIDINDLAEFEPQELITETEYVGETTAYSERAVIGDENGKALCKPYGNGYNGILSFDVADFKARYPQARYLYISMENKKEVELVVDGIAILPEWTGVPQLKERVAELENSGGQEEPVTPSSLPNIVFPRKVVAVVGHEFNMYYRNVVQCYNIDNYIIYCSISPNPSSIFNKNNTNMLGDCFRITPPEGSEGVYTLCLRLKDKVTGEIVTEKTTVLNVIADTAVSGKKVLFIGDSLTDAGIYPAEIQHNLSNGGIVSLGTRNDIVKIGDVSLTVNHEGRSGWASYDYTRSVANYRTDVDNPFWNETAEAFDFSYYMAQQGYDGVDVVCINLGTNGVANSATIPAIDEMIRSIHQYDSNIKIIVSLITQGATQNGFGTYVGIMSGSQFDYDAITLVKRYIEKYDGVNANVDVSELYFCLDKLYDFDIRTEAVSARNPETRVVQTNNVHPNKYGYLKFADVYYNNILYHLTV